MLVLFLLCNCFNDEDATRFVTRILDIISNNFPNRIHLNYEYISLTVALFSWSLYYGYHIVQVPEVVMECCSGFNGTDCTTRKKWLLHNYKYFFPCILKNLITDSTTLCIKAICTTSCGSGYSCTSPDECTPNTTFIGRLTQQFSPFVVFSYLFINILNFFQTLRTPQLVPVLWSMKLLQLLLSQVKLSTKAGGLYSLKWWWRAFHIFIEEHQCKIVYVTCSLCFYTLQMNKCRRIQNIFEF